MCRAGAGTCRRSRSSASSTRLADAVEASSGPDCPNRNGALVAQEIQELPDGHGPHSRREPWRLRLHAMRPMSVRSSSKVVRTSHGLPDTFMPAEIVQPVAGRLRFLPWRDRASTSAHPASPERACRRRSDGR